MKYAQIFFFLFFSLCVTAQDYEFIGALKLRGDDTNVITYKLVFKENNGVVTGYSVTDLNGPHETKNSISGTYNKKDKTFTFKENDIIYTKSTFNESSFCFVNYSGKVKLVNNNSKVEGEFKGLFKNKTKCIDGTILLVGSEKIYKLVNKINKKVQKSNKITTVEKEKYNVNKILDSLVINKISTNENLNVFWENTTFELEIWDAGKEDVDKVNVYHNDVLILRNYEVKNKKHIIKVKLLTNNDIFKIEAVSEGEITPNTAKLKIIDKNKTFEIMASLKKGEFAKITINKKAP